MGVPVGGLPRLDGSSASAQDIVDKLHSHGVVIVDRLVPPSDMIQLQNDLSQTEGRFRGSPGSFAGSNTVRNCGKSLGESKVVQNLAEHPLIVQATRLRLTACRRIVLGTCSAIDIEPDDATSSNRPQELHRDDSMWGLVAWPWLPHNHDRPELSVSVMWAVSDFTKENGCTRFIPGSHLWKRPEGESYEDEDLFAVDENRPEVNKVDDPEEVAALEEQCEYAIMTQGSVVLWSGGTLHGAGSYSSPTDGKARNGLLFLYNLGWLRSEMNFHWAIPLEVIQGFSDTLKELIGYIGSNRSEHPWFTGPIYAQPLLGS